MGILLHYSTLATALWVGVTARNIYKQVTRKAKRYEELDEPPPPPRPMLRSGPQHREAGAAFSQPPLGVSSEKHSTLKTLSRFYLIGGGIPIIVCGITAAANIKNYGSRPNAP